jgi:hypothetical protein
MLMLSFGGLENITRRLSRASIFAQNTISHNTQHATYITQHATRNTQHTSHSTQHAATEDGEQEFTAEPCDGTFVRHFFSFFLSFIGQTKGLNKVTSASQIF